MEFWPPVVASVKINFLASLTVSGVTSTRRFGCQTLILLEKLMMLKRSPGRRSLRMVNRASLVWERKCERKKNDNKQTECWMNNVMVELCSLYCDSRAAVVRNKTHMPSISQRPALWPAHTHSTHEAIPGGWCQQFRKLVSKCVVNYLWCQKLCLSINILETFYSLTLVIHLSEYPVGFKWFPYGIVMFFLSQYTVTM